MERARQLCEKLLAYASPLDLFGEEIDTRSGRHLGNFPQAFTHLALINAVMHVIEAERHPGQTSAPLAPRSAASDDQAGGPVTGAPDAVQVEPRTATES